jgi:hypothetical protein
MERIIKEDVMKVYELIEMLQKESIDREVVIAKDGEGNDYSPLYGMWRGAYRADTTYSGEAGLEKLTIEDEERGYSEDDVVNGVPALILYPVN